MILLFYYTDTKLRDSVCDAEEEKAKNLFEISNVAEQQEINESKKNSKKRKKIKDDDDFIASDENNDEEEVEKKSRTGRPKRYVFLTDNERNRIGRNLRKTINFVATSALFAFQQEELNKLGKDVLKDIADGKIKDNAIFTKANNLVQLVQMWGDPSNSIQFCGNGKMLLKDLIKETEEKVSDPQISLKALEDIAQRFLDNNGVHKKKPRQPRKEGSTTKRQKDKQKKLADSLAPDCIRKMNHGEGEAEADLNTSSVGHDDSCNQQQGGATTATTTTTTTVPPPTAAGPNNTEPHAAKSNMKLSSMFLSDIVNDSVDDSTETYPEEMHSVTPIRTVLDFSLALEDIFFKFPSDYPTKLVVGSKLSSSELIVLLGKMQQLQRFMMDNILSKQIYWTEFRKLVAELVHMQLHLFNRDIVVAAGQKTSREEEEGELCHNVPACLSLFYCCYMLLVRTEVFKNSNKLLSYSELFMSQKFNIMECHQDCVKLLNMVMDDKNFFEEVKSCHDKDYSIFEQTYGHKFSIENVEEAIASLNDAIKLLEDWNELGNDAINELCVGKAMQNKCMIFCQKQYKSLPEEGFPVMFFEHYKGNNKSILSASSQNYNGGSLYFSYDTLRNLLSNPVDNAICLFDNNHFMHLQLHGCEAELGHFEEAFDTISVHIHNLMQRVDISNPFNFTAKVVVPPPVGSNNTATESLHNLKASNDQPFPAVVSSGLKKNKLLNIKKRIAEALKLLTAVSNQQNITNNSNNSSCEESSNEIVCRLGKEVSDIVDSLITDDR